MPATDRQYRYLEILEVPREVSAKTRIWHVWSKDYLSLLGVIKWYGAWRSYAFFPNPDTLYEHNCLWDIADFVAQRTHEIRETWKKGNRGSTRNHTAKPDNA